MVALVVHLEVQWCPDIIPFDRSAGQYREWDMKRCNQIYSAITLPKLIYGMLN